MLVILFINGELCRNGSETLPRVGHIRTQVDLYQYQHSRLPFDDAEAGNRRGLSPPGPPQPLNRPLEAAGERLAPCGSA